MAAWALLFPEGMSVRSLWPLILMVSVITLGCPSTNGRGPITKTGKTSGPGNPDELKVNTADFMMKDGQSTCLNLPKLIKYLDSKTDDNFLVIDTAFDI